MIGNLTEDQMDLLLHKEIVGRIGCHLNNTVYVVPVSYAYNGKSIYVHSREGVKLTAMRANPNVCFEVDDLKDMGNWQSIICWGVFKEINNMEERDYALQLLQARPLPFLSSITTHLGEGWPFPSGTSENIDGIFFRIQIEKRTGKFENTSKSSPY